MKNLSYQETSIRSSLIQKSTHTDRSTSVSNLYLTSYKSLCSEGLTLRDRATTLCVKVVLCVCVCVCVCMCVCI